MFSWIARTLLIAAGLVTSWFVAKDAPNFGLIQLSVALMLFMLVLFVLAFWPAGWTIKPNRLKKPQQPVV